MLSGIRVCSPDTGLSGSLTGNPRKLDYLYLIRINRRNIWVLLRLILSSTHRDLIFPLTAIQSESLWTRQKVVSLSYKYGFTLGQEFRSSFTVCFRPVLCGVKWKVIESADNTCLGLLDGDRYAVWRSSVIQNSLQRSLWFETCYSINRHKCVIMFTWHRWFLLCIVKSTITGSLDTSGSLRSGWTSISQDNATDCQCQASAESLTRIHFPGMKIGHVQNSLIKIISRYYLSSHNTHPVILIYRNCTRVNCGCRVHRSKMTSKSAPEVSAA